MATVPLTLSPFTLAEIDRLLARARAVEGTAPSLHEFVQATVSTAVAQAIARESDRINAVTVTNFNPK